MSLKETIKQFFCSHKGIDTTTEVRSIEPLIISSLIQCHDCKKTFAQHPNAQCCYVLHLHGEILREQFIDKIK